MVVASVCLDIPRKGRVQGRVAGSDPVQNYALQTLSIIRPCTGYTPLNLEMSEKRFII
jgi:hypothetical protein